MVAARTDRMWTGGGQAFKGTQSPQLTPGLWFAVQIVIPEVSMYVQSGSHTSAIPLENPDAAMKRGDIVNFPSSFTNPQFEGQ